MHVGLNLVYLVPGETGGLEVYARELIQFETCAFDLSDDGVDSLIEAFVKVHAARTDLRKVNAA